MYLDEANVGFRLTLTGDDVKRLAKVTEEHPIHDRNPRNYFLLEGAAGASDEDELTITKLRVVHLDDYTGKETTIEL